MAPVAGSNLLGLRLTTIDLVGGIHCSICRLNFTNKKEYDSHYSQHNLGKDEIVYTCVICFKDIAGYPSFRGHCYTIHVMKDRFKCDYCNKFFSKGTALKDHIASLHKFQCSTCKREFPSKKELQLHKIVHMNDKPPFNCQTCNEEVDCIDACELHIDRHSVSVYSCPICSKKINSKEEAVDHLSEHFGDVLNNSNDSDSDSEYDDKPEDSSIDLLGGIICTACKIIFKNRAETDLHFSQEHPELPVLYGCNICQKGFEKYGQFGAHCYDHVSKKRFKCESCDKSFNRLARLVTHTEAFHARPQGSGTPQGSGKPLACQQCPQTFGSEFRLRSHLRADHGICVIMCSQPDCGQIFETPKELIYHQKHHSPPSELWCRLCGLQFLSLGAAARHLPLHRKQTVACPVCARTYAEKYLLMKHVPQHFETVIHMCKVCGKLYNAKNRLIEHAKTHANIKNYNCSFCGKGFTSDYKLKQHHNLHTGRQPYRCVACARPFNHYSNWYKHLHKIHKIDPKTIKQTMDVAKDNDVTIEEKENDDKIEENPMENLMPDNIEIANELIESEMKETYLFMEPTAEPVDLDSIDPSIAPETGAEFTVLPPAATFVSAASSMPREYGPDFTRTDGAGLLHLDDHMLPHVDPLLITRPQDEWEPMLATGPQDKWEPMLVTRPQDQWEPMLVTRPQDRGLINKHQGCYGDVGASRLALMNTDIF